MASFHCGLLVEDSWWRDPSQFFLLSPFFSFFGQKSCSCFVEGHGLEPVHRVAAGPSLAFLPGLTASPTSAQWLLLSAFSLGPSCHLWAPSLRHQLLWFWKTQWTPSYHLGLLNRAEWQTIHLEGLGSDLRGKEKSPCTLKRWLAIWPGKDAHFTFHGTWLKSFTIKFYLNKIVVDI